MQLKVFGRKAADGVRIFRDAAMTDLFVRFDNWHSSKPDYRNKYITLNCYCYQLEWIK